MQAEFAKTDFHYICIKLCNGTHAEIRELPSLDRYKKQLKTYLKQSQLQVFPLKILSLDEHTYLRSNSLLRRF